MSIEFSKNRTFSAEKPVLAVPAQTDDVILHVLACKQAIKRLANKLNKQQEELKESQSFEHFQQTGDTLLANISAFPRGSSSCQVTNVYTGAIETVKLNPKLSILQNAELYFKKAKKGKRGLEIIEKLVAQTNQELDIIKTYAEKLDRSRKDSTPFDEQKTEAARLLLRKMGLLPRSTETPKNKHEEPVPYRHLTLAGWDMYIGKNDAQNDELTTRFARPWDVWLHVAAHSGSHVVIRREKNSPLPPKNILETAASFAIWFSQAKHTSYAEVHYTEKRYVYKRHKAPPGEVSLQQFKTLRVSPKSPQEFFKDRPDLNDGE
jgi:predicted ribosome quality control (RQC) complex YloA/Tae2 family protein